MAVDVKSMEVKKGQQLAKPDVSSAKEADAKAEKWQNYFAGIKEEFSKLTWTNREELMVYTKIVVAGTFLLGMGIYFADLAIQLSLNSLEYIIRLIGG